MIVSFLKRLLIFSYRNLVYLILTKCGIILYKFINSNFFKLSFVFVFKFSSVTDVDSELLLLFGILIFGLFPQHFGNIFEKIRKKILSIVILSSQFKQFTKLDI